MSATQHFTPRGKLQVISISASQASSSDQLVSVSVQPTSISEPLEKHVDQRLPLEQLDFNASLDSDPLPRVPQTDLPAPPPQQVFPSPINEAANAFRRASAEEMPEVAVAIDLPPPRIVRPAQGPPTDPVSPLQEISGLKENETADLSNNPAPAYPVQAIRNRWQGVVTLRLQITESGEVAKVDVIQSSGHQVLDRAAVDAVKRWRGKPARRWGRRIASEETLPVRFRL